MRSHYSIHMASSISLLWTDGLEDLFAAMHPSELRTRAYPHSGGSHLRAAMPVLSLRSVRHTRWASFTPAEMASAVQGAGRNTQHFGAHDTTHTSDFARSWSMEENGLLRTGSPKDKKTEDYLSCRFNSINQRREAKHM